MKHYQLTSDAFTGAVDFYFNNDGLLSRFDTEEATLSIEQSTWLLKHLPRELSELSKVLEKSTTAKLTEVKREVTFQMFWDRYDDKVISSKKKTEAKWARMSKSQQIRAYDFIQKYFLNLPTNTRKKYAETYLNNELWNNSTKK